MKDAVIKKTGQRVKVIGSCGSDHSMVMFPFPNASKKGNRANVQPVRNSNLQIEKQELGFAG